MKFISPSGQWVWERKSNWPYFYFILKYCCSFVSPSCQKSWGLQSICFLFQTRFGASQKRTKRWKMWMPIQWRLWVHACADYLNVPNNLLSRYHFCRLPSSSVLLSLLLNFDQPINPSNHNNEQEPKCHQIHYTVVYSWVSESVYSSSTNDL